MRAFRVLQRLFIQALDYLKVLNEISIGTEIDQDFEILRLALAGIWSRNRRLPDTYVLVIEKY